MNDTKSAHSKKPAFYVSDRLYDFLKFFVMIVAPSAASLYILAGKIFNLPDTMLYIIVVYLLLSAFLGGVLIFLSRSRSRIRYGCDGSMIVKPRSDGGTIYSLELDEDPVELKEKNVVSFLVVHESRSLRTASNETI